MKLRDTLSILLVAGLLVLVSACKCSHESGSDSHGVSFSAIVPQTIGVFCYGYSGAIQAVLKVASDTSNNQGFLAVPPTVTFDFLNNSATGLGKVYTPLIPQLDGISGPFTLGQQGWHFDGSGSTFAKNFSLKATLTFDVVLNPQAPPSVVNLNLSLLADADKAMGQVATTWTGSGAVTATKTPARCGWQAFSAEPVTMSSGEYVLDPAADLSLGGPLPLELHRHYGSLLSANGIVGRLGANWTHNFEIKLALSGSDATVILSDGGSINFTKSGSDWVLERKQPLSYQFAQSGTNYQFLDAGTNLIYTFSSAGALTRIEDRNGNALTLTQPSLISDGLGRTLTFTYGSDNNLASVKDQSGRTVSFTYSNGTLATVTDANGKVTSYTYTTGDGRAGLLTTVKRPAGNTTLTQIWDPSGRVFKQTDALNNSTAYAYGDPAPGMGTVTDALGGKTQFAHSDLQVNNAATDANGKQAATVYDALYHPLQVTDRLGNKTVATYDPVSGLATSVTDAGGGVTTLSYTAQTQGPFTFYVIAKRVGPDGASTTYQYDANGNLLSVTGPAGNSTTYTRNKQGLALTITNSGGAVTTNTYNADGTLASTTAPNGDVTTYGYDTLKRRVKVTGPDGAIQMSSFDGRDRLLQRGQQTYVYDDNGNLKSGLGVTASYNANDQLVSVTSLAGTRSVVYNELGRPKSVTNEAGETTSIAYDILNRPTAALDAAGNGFHAVWNAEGFLQSVSDALSRTTTFTTDPLGRFLSITTPLGEKYTNTFDKAGRLVSTTTPLAHTWKFTYGPGGGLTKMELPANISASYTLGNVNEVSAITDPNGGVWTRTHDKLGRLTAFSDPLSRSTTLQYGALNRLTSASGAAGNATFAYNAGGALTSAQFTGGAAAPAFRRAGAGDVTLNYQYGSGGLASADNLTLAYNATGDIVSSNGIAIARDSLRRIKSITYAPGLTVAYKYNSLGDLVEVDDWVGDATLLKYDLAHYLTSIQRPNGTVTTFTRNASGLLVGKTEITASGTYSVSLTRDAERKVVSADRNLPQAPQPAGGVNGYSYDAAHQMTGATYDSAGRLLSDGLRSYTWDAASRLAAYNGVDGAAQFTYDGLGLRVSRTTADGERDYVWNYAHPTPALAIVRSAGADLRYYVYLPGGFLLHSIEAADNSRHFYHFDEAGSTTFLTDDTGSVSDAYGITPFGESVTQTGMTENPFTFHGAWGVMQEGSTSLYYLRARYYDSASGRFLSRDPVLSLEPRQINPYQFALNNPLGYRDPRGTNVAEPVFGFGSSPFLRAATRNVFSGDDSFQAAAHALAETIGPFPEPPKPVPTTTTIVTVGVGGGGSRLDDVFTGGGGSRLEGGGTEEGLAPPVPVANADKPDVLSEILKVLSFREPVNTRLALIATEIFDSPEGSQSNQQIVEIVGTDPPDTTGVF